MKIDYHIETSRRFQEFHAANPEVYNWIVGTARKLKAALVARGRKPRYSIYALVEQFRWHVLMETTGADYKFDNSFTPYYNRLIQQQEPDLKGFFAMRGRALQF